MTGTLPPYPGDTKEFSVNYGGGGEPFALANDIEDALDPRDIWLLARAVEDHQHGTGRGLPINRIGTASAPQAPGDIQVMGDDFRWWGDDSDAVLSAVNTTTAQTVNGTKRLNDPLLLPRQASAPPAPGAGLGYVYLGPGDRLFLRAGTNQPTPVGTPALLAAPLAWQTTQGAGQAQVQQIALGGAGVWTLGYRATGNDYASLFTSAPPTYGGTPITVTVAWTGPTGTGKVAFTLFCRITPPGGDLNQPWVEVVKAAADASGGAWANQQSVLSWTTGLPAAGSALHYALQRSNTDEVAAGGSYPQVASVHMVTLTYG
jgi:hypothetical protein